MNCELCGREDELVDAIVEGSLISVCSNCSKFGVVVKKKEETRKEIKFTRLPEDEVNEFVVDDYSIEVKQSRERSGLTQVELAKKLNIKESVVHKIESSSLIPSLDLARKLEIVLKIKLIERNNAKYEKKNISLRDKNLTIGDLLSLKKKTI